MRPHMVVALLCLCLQGCATTQTQSLYDDCVETYTGYDYYSYRIEFVSEPPGAKIEWNNEYVGETPIAIRYDGHLGLLAKITVRAYPLFSGQFIQTKIISGTSRIPRRIYFDMNLKPAPLELDLRLRDK